MAMASSSATSRVSFSSHVPQPNPPTPLIPKPHHISYPLSHLLQKPISIHSRPQLPLSRSIDVSQEDKPTWKEPILPSEAPDEDNLPTESESFDARRLEEKFAVLSTGIHECRSCGYNYNEAIGDPSYPIPPGLPFDRMPEDWRCPTCGAAKSFFQSKSVEVAGFAQNQQFGFGGNTLTSDQKALLIYGGLFFGFLVFLSGYFLQ
ncbi:unnamed protein product [Cuscuta epithymum]|uniref:Rubredoxin-like domain-containing protein n=1 Tax=Cuscuta epithymum TaxID=186058 RepID=A0AAV0GD37_9ASTE|nr:unnamed protein product [Cuscuta epithymum]